MIWFRLLVLAANLSTLIANPFPVTEDAVDLFSPDSETQLQFSTTLLADEPIFDDTYSPPDATYQGEDSDLFAIPPVLITLDNTAEQSPAFTDLDNSVLASDGSSCGTQGRSGDLPTDSEPAIDSFGLDSLEARGFLDDVEKLNEIIDPPTRGSCAAPNSQVSPERQRERRPYKKPSEDTRLGPEPWEADFPIPVKDFGQCPALQPEYREALCCTGEHYGIYVMKCARAAVSFFCGSQANHYCCKEYNEYDLIGIDCIRVSWPEGLARPFPLDPPYTGHPGYPDVQEGYQRTNLDE